MEVEFRNVNDALPGLIDVLHKFGRPEASRNGPVQTMSTPTLVKIRQPVERVLLCPVRRAMPFLFLLDGLSILSTVNLVKPFADIAPRMRNFSDDGVHLRGHYGRRLRPQLMTTIEMLRRDPTTRRVVMQIWDRAEDLGADSVDIPCNVMVIPRIVNRLQGMDVATFLDLTVINRSNDLFWGMMGANVVQFSFLQEFMAAELGVQVGHLYQFSTNLHFYKEFGPGAMVDRAQFTSAEEANNRFYPQTRPLDTENLLHDLDMLFLALNDGTQEWPMTENKFLNSVVYPMLDAWADKSTVPLRQYPDCDWFEAARMWFREPMQTWGVI